MNHSSQSQTLSRQFESLIKDIFKLEFNLRKEDIILTQMTHDGGRDVEFAIETITNILPNIQDKVWIEAKMRNSDKVQLNEIAGNIIIATNTNVNKIYFISNNYFSKQAITQLVLLRIRTGLSIVIVDGYKFRLLIKHWKHNLYDHKYIVDLISPNLPQEIDITTKDLNFVVDIDNCQIRSIPNKKKNTIYKTTSTLLANIEKEEPKIFNIDSVDINFNSVLDNYNNEPINKGRADLLQDTICNIKSNKTIYIEGNEGQGKSFMLSLIHNNLQQKGWLVYKFNIALNETILSFTKQFIINITSINYLNLIEKEDADMIEFMSISFDVSRKVSKEILYLLKGKLNDSILPINMCTTLLFSLISNCRERKNFLLLIDNIHNANSELYSFLVNLFDKLNQIDIAVVTTTSNNFNWKNHLPSKSVECVIEDFNKNDLIKFIGILLPGANENIIDLILLESLNIPANVKIFTDYIINLGGVESKDNKHFIINNIKCADINSRITPRVYEKCFKNIILRDVAVYSYLFDNKIDIKVLEVLIPDFDIELLHDTFLFKRVYDNNSDYISFSHLSYFKNIESAFPNKKTPLEHHAITILKCAEKLVGLIPKEVLGNILEHTGNFEEAYKVYRDLGLEIRHINPRRAISVLDKSMNSYLNILGGKIEEERIDELCDLIFDLMGLYNKFNMLPSNNAVKLYDILRRYNDNGLLTGRNKVLYYFFMGQRETKQEHFLEAHEYFKKAQRFINEFNIEDKNIIYKINHSYGIDLKHLGRRKESIDFFNDMCKKHEGVDFINERESNQAAYYLSTGEYKKSLECYTRMKNNGCRNFHLQIDFAMTRFYLNEYDKSIDVLDEVIPKARDAVNRSEVARGYNIKGAVYWMLEEYKKAEYYFDRANSASELSNNHRWLWRIRTNLAQLALHNNKEDKAKNICFNIIDHLCLNEENIIFELSTEGIHSKRFAALKAITLIFNRTNDDEGHKYLSDKFPNLSRELSFYIKNDKNFDNEKDPNFFLKERAYIILG